MIKPTIKIVDVSTQEEIVREMNDEEYAQYQQMVADQQQMVADQLAKQASQNATE